MATTYRISTFNLSISKLYLFRYTVTPLLEAELAALRRASVLSAEEVPPSPGAAAGC